MRHKHAICNNTFTNKDGVRLELTMGRSAKNPSRRIETLTQCAAKSMPNKNLNKDMLLYEMPILCCQRSKSLQPKRKEQTSAIHRQNPADGEVTKRHGWTEYLVITLLGAKAGDKGGPRKRQHSSGIQ